MWGVLCDTGCWWKLESFRPDTLVETLKSQQRAYTCKLITSTNKFFIPEWDASLYRHSCQDQVAFLRYWLRFWFIPMIRISNRFTKKIHLDSLTDSFRGLFISSVWVNRFVKNSSTNLLISSSERVLLVNRQQNRSFNITNRTNDMPLFL